MQEEKGMLEVEEGVGGGGEVSSRLRARRMRSGCQSMLLQQASVPKTIPSIAALCHLKNPYFAHAHSKVFYNDGVDDG